MSGKGSSPRPFAVSAEDFSARWDAIFSKKGNSNDESIQKETSGPNGSIEADPIPKGGSNSSGDRTLPADNQPSQ
jgi:hypothetical protein